MDWYRWFPSLYAESTLHLSLEQDAIYRRLIDWYMAGRMPLPCQAIALARICQISLDKWLEHESVLTRFLIKKGDKYHIKRCDIELDRQDSTSRKLGEAALKAHIARKNNKENQKDISLGNAEALALPHIEEKRREEKRYTETDNLLTLTVENHKKYPEGYETFWSKFPKKRRDPKDDPKTIRAFEQALEFATAEELNSAVIAYAASDEVARGFAKGTQAWLKAKRWTHEYSAQPQIYASAV